MAWLRNYWKKGGSLKVARFPCRGDQNVRIDHEAQRQHQRFFFSNFATSIS